MDATVASASPQRAETPRTTSSRERATVVLLTDSTKRYSDRIAPTARTEARNRESLTRGTSSPRSDGARRHGTRPPCARIHEAGPYAAELRTFSSFFRRGGGVQG